MEQLPTYKPLHALVGPNDSGKSRLLREIGEALEVSYEVFRFDADSLRAPSPLIPEYDGVIFADERGRGLAGVYDVILNRDLSVFQAIQAKVCALFPNVARLGLANVSETHKEMAVTLHDGERVLAQDISDGLLYFLAFLALEHVKVQLLLIEHPELGLHPSRVGDVMDILRSLSASRQVIVTTHSPFVLNELQGDEITLVSRDRDRGVSTRLLKDVPGFDRAMKVYQPGEFWVAYSDGLKDEALLTGRARA